MRLSARSAWTRRFSAAVNATGAGVALGDGFADGAGDVTAGVELGVGVAGTADGAADGAGLAVARGVVGVDEQAAIRRPMATAATTELRCFMREATFRARGPVARNAR